MSLGPCHRETTLGQLPQTQVLLCSSSDLRLKENGNKATSSGHGYTRLN